MAMQSEPGVVAALPRSRKYFTLDEASRALNYVRRITQDVRSSYRAALNIQQQLERSETKDDLQGLERDYERTVEELNRFVAELHRAGVEIKDYDLGLVDFPCLHEGREVSLCWRLGEQSITAWHEVDAGYAGRKDVALLGPG